MLQYRALLYARHQLPVKQLVYYLGNGTYNMRYELLQEGLQFSYRIINIADFDYEPFVASSKPEEVILAILCNFRERRPAEVIRRILQKLNEVVGTSGIGKYIRQLEVLSNLRNLQEQIKKEVDVMPFNIDLSKDRLFVKGIELGEEKGMEKGREAANEAAIINLLVKLGLSAEQTAAVLDAPLELVKQIQRKIQQK